MSLSKWIFIPSRWTHAHYCTLLGFNPKFASSPSKQTLVAYSTPFDQHWIDPYKPPNLSRVVHVYPITSSSHYGIHKTFKLASFVNIKTTSLIQVLITSRDPKGFKLIVKDLTWVLLWNMKCQHFILIKLRHTFPSIWKQYCWG